MPELNRKKVLLIHPLGYSSDLAKHDISRKANIMPPLGLASIAAFLEDKEITTDIIDCYAQPDYLFRVKDYLMKEKPLFLGVSCTTSSFLDGIEITKLAKTVCPGIQAVFGGPHVSALKEKVLEDFPAVDFVVVGEGEQTLFELIKTDKDKITEIKGLVSRNDSGRITFSGYQDKLLDLDQLPFPAYEKLAGFPDAYQLPIFNYPHTPNISCISSRGCPYACSYCDRSVFRRSFRYNSAKYLYDHVNYLNKHFGIRHINFYDDQFTFNRERVVEFTKLLLDNNIKITFNCAVRADHIDFELLEQMKEAGCWMISLGIETGDEDLLAKHRQNVNLKSLAEKIRLVKKAGIRVKGLLMMGLPGETEISIRKSMKYVFSLPIDDINLAKFTPFPGAPLYQDISTKGEFDEDWPKMDCMHFQFIPLGMNHQQLEQLHQEYYKRHFMRWKTIWGYITMLWRSPNSWVRFVRNLTYFLQFARSSKRIA